MIINRENRNGATRSLFIAGLMMGVLGSSSFAVPKQNLSFDLAFGVPHLLTANANFMIWKKWQAGLGYGFLPPVGVMSTGMALPAMSVPGPDGITLVVYPTAKSAFSWVNPYLRFFPGTDNFYFQVSYFYYAVSFDITSTVEDGNSQIITTSGISGKLTLRQFLPTIGIGCIFGSNLFFFNLNMGYSFVGATTMGVELTGALGQLGELAPDVVTSMENAMGELVTIASDGPKSVVRNWPFPSINFSFGFYF